MSSEKYEEDDIVNFGEAVEHMKKDDWNKVARAGWNGKGMWVHKVTPPSSPFSSDGNDGYEALPYIEMKTADNKFVPWLASQTDILAEDWVIV